MARRFNINAHKTISMDLTQLQLPPAVIIGKKGVVINALKTITHTNMRVVDGRLQIKGSFKEVSAAKNLVKKIAQDFYENGKINIQIPKPRQVRPNIQVKTDQDGWTTRSSNKMPREEKEESVAAPQRIVHQNIYGALDDSDEDEVEVEKKEEWPSISTKKFTSSKTTGRRWADIADDEDDDEDDEFSAVNEAVASGFVTTRD